MTFFLLSMRACEKIPPAGFLELFARLKLDAGKDARPCLPRLRLAGFFQQRHKRSALVYKWQSHALAFDSSTTCWMSVVSQTMIFNNLIKLILKINKYILKLRNILLLFSKNLFTKFFVPTLFKCRSFDLPIYDTTVHKKRLFGVPLPDKW